MTVGPDTKPAHDSPQPQFVHVEEVMGMAVTITVDGGTPTAIEHGIVAAVAWLHSVDRTYSTYKSDSTITRFARNELRIEDLDTEVIEVLDLCEQAFIDTDGAFDAHSVKAPNGTMFEPSGLVKGWSVERAADIMKSHGLVDFTINAGGDIALRGGRGEQESSIRHRPTKSRSCLKLPGGSPSQHLPYTNAGHTLSTRKPVWRLLQ